LLLFSYFFSLNIQLFYYILYNALIRGYVLNFIIILYFTHQFFFIHILLFFYASHWQQLENCIFLFILNFRIKYWLLYYGINVLHVFTSYRKIEGGYSFNCMLSVFIWRTFKLLYLFILFYFWLFVKSCNWKNFSMLYFYLFLLFALL
jgi:hypothetical protein